MRGLIACLVLAVSVSAAFAQETIVLDDFERIDSWAAHPADGVELTIGSDPGVAGQAMRLDFRFLKGGGYAIARRALDLELPENYAFTFMIRGDAPSEHLEFKLIDSTNENVWWSVRRDMEFPGDWARFTIKRRQIQFAWGPIGGGEIRRVAALELAITAGSGGEGTVWIDQLELRPLPPADAAPPPLIATASSARSGFGASLAVDGDPTTRWVCEEGDGGPWLRIDAGIAREFGGVSIDWAAGGAIPGYALEGSDDGEEWTELRRVEGSNGGRDHLFLPESEARFLRLRMAPAAGAPVAGIAELRLQPLSWSSSREVFFREVASEHRRGLFPRGISGEQSFWTVLGVDGDRREALMNEDGMIETGMRAFSVEPFLLLEDRRLVTWADAAARLSLDHGGAPIPAVTWSVDNLGMTVTAFGRGEPGASSILVRYRIRNLGAEERTPKLVLALRPFQVNPPAQFLNHPGGTAPIRTIDLDGADARSNGGTARVNGREAVVSLRSPSAGGASSFDSGDIVADWIAEGTLPDTQRADDSFEAASGAWIYDLSLPARGEEEIALWIPLYDGLAAPVGTADRLDAEQESTRTRWQKSIKKVQLNIPEGEGIVQTLYSQIAYIMINRAGPAIQPGTRAYARSWIRDGSLTCSALLRMGIDEPVREFIEWFAPYQYANGKVPCCVDARGSDPVPEHDSSGQLIFLIAEYYRYTGDRELADRMWPNVDRAAAYLDSLRRERMTPEYEAMDKREFYGILPPSISHEGYSAKPMHSYWDDFFALRGFRDAAYLAGELGHEGDAARLRSIAGEFQDDLLASIAAAMQRHGIDYIPGCADMGDFDATSTTIALSPVGADAVLPREALERTFERYYEFFKARKEGAPWEAFTPYEMRTIGAFVRLGWRERAHELVDYFLAHRRPPEWEQWPEIVWSDLRTPRFQGDLPHTWVGSDYVRSILDFFVYVEDRSESIVLMAGVAAEWVLEDGGLRVLRMPTPYGEVSYTARGTGSYTMHGTGPGGIEVLIEGNLRMPAGGIRVYAPFPWGVEGASVDGVPAQTDPEGRLIVRSLPARILIPPPAR